MPTIGYSYTTDNEEIPVKDGSATNPLTRGFIGVGVDALGVARFLRADASGSITVNGVVTSKLADENGNFFTSSEKNNTRSLAVESRDLVLLLGQILGELRLMRSHLGNITDEDDPL